MDTKPVKEKVLMSAEEYLSAATGTGAAVEQKAALLDADFLEVRGNDLIIALRGAAKIAWSDTRPSTEKTKRTVCFRVGNIDRETDHVYVTFPKGDGEEVKVPHSFSFQIVNMAIRPARD